MVSFSLFLSGVGRQVSWSISLSTLSQALIKASCSLSFIWVLTPNALVYFSCTRCPALDNAFESLHLFLSGVRRKPLGLSLFPRGVRHYFNGLSLFLSRVGRLASWSMYFSTGNLVLITAALIWLSFNLKCNAKPLNLSLLLYGARRYPKPLGLALFLYTA